MNGKCQLHGKVKYLYIPSVGAKLCDGCLSAGLYKEGLYEEAKAMYPELVKDTYVKTANHSTSSKRS